MKAHRFLVTLSIVALFGVSAAAAQSPLVPLALSLQQLDQDGTLQVREVSDVELLSLGAVSPLAAATVGQFCLPEPTSASENFDLFICSDWDTDCDYGDCLTECFADWGACVADCYAEFGGNPEMVQDCKNMCSAEKRSCKGDCWCCGMGGWPRPE